MGLDTWGHRKLGSFEPRRAKGRGTFRCVFLEGCLANSCSPTCSAKVGLESASPSWVQLIIVMGPMDYETLDPGFRFQGRQALSGATGLPDTYICSSRVRYFMEVGPIGQGNSAPRCQFSSLPGSVRGYRSSWHRNLFKQGPIFYQAEPN